MSIRVVQWATGSIGKTCLRAVIDHPDLELAGLYVYSERKAGKDAGEIARRAPTGVLATRSIDEILALDADVVLHTPLNPADTLDAHDEVILRLLESGKSVITTVAHTYPQAMGADYAARFEEACRRGGSTLFGTGVNPGLIAERLTVLLTTMCTRDDAITTTEVYDCSDVMSPGFIFDLMGVGQPPEAVANGPRVQRVFNHIFGELVGFVGHALKVKFDEVRADHEFGVATREVRLPVGVVQPGGVVNFSWRPMAMVVNARGYYFEERRDGRWQGFDRPPFGLQSWKEGTAVQVAGLTKPGDGKAPSSTRVIFDSVGLASEDVALTLSRDGASAAVRIDRNGGVRLGE